MRQYTAMIDKRASDDKSVRKVQRWHSGELIDVGTTNEDAFCIVLADCIVEAEGFGEEARRHAGPESEDEECEEVAKSHRAADGGEVGKGWGGEVVPGNESEICY